MLKLLILIDCDVCGFADSCSSSDTDLTMWKNEAEAFDLDHELGLRGWHLESNRIFCPDCYDLERHVLYLQQGL